MKLNKELSTKYGVTEIVAEGIWQNSDSKLCSSITDFLYTLHRVLPNLVSCYFVDKETYKVEVIFSIKSDKGEASLSVEILKDWLDKSFPAIFRRNTGLVVSHINELLSEDLSHITSAISHLESYGFCCAREKITSLTGKHPFVDTHEFIDRLLVGVYSSLEECESSDRRGYSSSRSRNFIYGEKRR